MMKVAKVAVSLLLTVCGKPKTQSHIRLIREKAPLLPLAAAWPAIRCVLFDDREANR